MTSYFNIPEQAAYKLIKENDITRIRRNLDYTKKQNEQGKVNKNLGGYAVEAIKNDYSPQLSIAQRKEILIKDKERERRKKALEEELLISRLYEEYSQWHDSKTDELIANLSESRKETLFMEFAEQANTFIKKRLGEKRVKDLTTLERIEFDNFLSEKLLKPEDGDFILWAKKNGYELKENGYGSGSEKYILLNSVHFNEGS